MAASITIPHFLPGPHATPLLGWRGNVIPLYRDPISALGGLYRTYGSIVGLPRTNPAFVCAFGPACNHQLLSDAETFHSKPFEHIPIPAESGAQTLDTGLLSMNGAYHKQQRRLMMPAFHRKHIEGYCATMVAMTEQALARWRSMQMLDMASEMQHLTMDTALKALFGLDGGVATRELADIIRQLFGLLSSAGVALFPHDLPGTPYRRLLRLSDEVVVRVQGLISQKRATLSRGDDVLTTLIDARDEDGTAMTDRELIGQAYLLFVAGHETSSNALTWMLFLLAQHPQVMADLHDELRSVLGGAAPTIEQFAQLPLLERVVKESLRLLPPAAFGTRKAVLPFRMGPYDLPAGTSLIYSQYVTHRIPELYADPQRFWPERWGHCDPSPYEYLPFGAGPRMCIGATFALTEIKIVLAMLLQRYRLSVVPHALIDRRMSVTLSPRHGMPMRIVPQDRCFDKTPVRGNIHEMVDLR